MQIVNIQDTYMDSGSHLHIPVQEQASGELDSHYDMPELLWGTQAKDYDSSSDDLSSDDSSENPSDTTKGSVTKPLSAEKYHEIRDQMLDENSHIDMLNATGTKETESSCLDLSYVYLDTCSTFHQNINPDTMSNIHTVSHGLKSCSNGDVGLTN